MRCFFWLTTCTVGWLNKENSTVSYPRKRSPDFFHGYQIQWGNNPNPKNSQDEKNEVVVINRYFVSKLQWHTRFLNHTHIRWLINRLNRLIILWYPIAPGSRPPTGVNQSGRKRNRPAVTYNMLRTCDLQAYAKARAREMNRDLRCLLGLKFRN